VMLGRRPLKQWNKRHSVWLPRLHASSSTTKCYIVYRFLGVNGPAPTCSFRGLDLAKQPMITRCYHKLTFLSHASAPQVSGSCC
jgi:hypothetical protein